jgi:hypothetical protein
MAKILGPRGACYEFDFLGGATLETNLLRFAQWEKTLFEFKALLLLQ